MTDQTDAEFIAEISSRAENAANDHAVIYSRIALSPKTYELGEASRTAIPRLIGMVEAEKKRADDAEAWASCCQQDRDLANDTLYEEKAATERNAEIAERICIERNDAQVERDTALAEVARLRAVLEPFALQNDNLEDFVTNKGAYPVFFSVKQIEAARAALASKE